MSSVYDTIMANAMAQAQTPIHSAADDMAATLAQINSQRAAEGFPLLPALPSAITGNTSQCLYARAYGDMASVSVGGDGQMVFENTDRGKRLAFGLSRAPGARLINDHTVMAPSMFGNVIKHFDGHEFPEFDPGKNDPHYT